MRIAKEARNWLFLLALIAAAVNIAFGIQWAWPLWLLLAAAVFLTRDLPYKVPAVPLAIVSPVDGRITLVETATDPYLDREALRIGIQQSPLGEFTIHSPVEGKVRERWLRAASNNPADAAICIDSDEGGDVVVSVDIETWLRYARFNVQLGERVGQGQRWGLVGFGRPVTVYLPATAVAMVHPGEHVKAGSDMIAKFVRKK